MDVKKDQILIDLLRRAIANDNVTMEEYRNANFTDLVNKRGYHREAWFDLRIWIDDEDIRATDPQYSESKLKRLKWLLNEIDPEAPT
jgi:hypothetical protein